MRHHDRSFRWFLPVLFILSTAAHSGAQNTKQSPAGDAVALARQATQGDAQAQVYLGLMYATGEGVGKNEAEAIRWYRAAAEQGQAQAQFLLGSMYDVGPSRPKG